jgi:hypothetical protein
MSTIVGNEEENTTVESGKYSDTNGSRSEHSPRLFPFYDLCHFAGVLIFLHGFT